MSAWLIIGGGLGLIGSLWVWHLSGRSSRAVVLMYGRLGGEEAWLPLVGVLLRGIGLVSVFLNVAVFGEAVAAILSLILVWGTVTQLAKWWFVVRLSVPVITAYSEGVEIIRRQGVSNFQQLPDSLLSFGRAFSLADIAGFESGEHRIFVARTGALVKWQHRGEDVDAEKLAKDLQPFTEALHRMISERCPGMSGPIIMTETSPQP